jgi:PAS domain S-box-containing protein
MARENSFEESLSPDGRYRLLVEAITDYAIYMLDVNGLVSSWNAGARRFKGYEEAEILGEHFSRFYLEEDRRNGLPQHALDTAANEGRFEGEGWRVRKDGTRFWAHVVIDPIRDRIGHLIGYSKVTRDFTERKVSEDALRRSEDQFRLFVQAVTDYAIYTLDLEGRVTNWNAGAERIKGYRADEIMGQHFSRFYSEEDRKQGTPRMALETARREGRYEKEGWRIRKDGTRFWASVVIDAIRDKSGEVIGFAKITRDITERMEAQNALTQAREALLQSQKMEAIGQLTGGVAHDFNNLLTVIRSSIDLLRRPNLSEDRRRRYIDAIGETVTRGAKLTGQLLAFARRQALKPEVFDVARSIATISDMLATLGGARIRLETHVPEFETFYVNADRSQLDTALVNFALNARDAMNGEGRLSIAVQGLSNIPANHSHPAMRGDFVAISVSDTGSGIPPELLERIFEPFFTTKNVGKGTGLGLSQVFGFVKQSGGDVRVESTLGRGSKFTIFLPRVAAPQGADLAAESAQSLSDGNGVCVLIVEDNPTVGAFAAHTLNELNYDAVLADSADAALAELEKNPSRFDIVFSDVVMPSMSGLELGLEIRRRYPDLPVILTSGYSHVLASDTNHGFELLHKPYSLEEVSKVLSKVRRQRTAS